MAAVLEGRMQNKPKRKRYTHYPEGSWEHYLLNGYRLGEDWRPGIKNPHAWAQLHNTKQDGSGHYVSLERGSGKPRMLPEFLSAISKTGIVKREHVKQAVETIRRHWPELILVLEWHAKPNKLISRNQLAERVGCAQQNLARLRDRAMTAIWNELPDHILMTHQRPDVALIRDEESEVDE